MGEPEVDISTLESRLPPWTRALLAAVAQDRQREALILRASGQTLREIGERLGVTGARAGDLVERATRKMTEVAERAVHEHAIAPSVHPHQPGLCPAHRCEVPRDMYAVLDLPVTALRLGPHPRWTLMSYGIEHVGQLVEYDEHRLLQFNNMGYRGIGSVRKALAQLALHLDMDVGDWKPPAPAAPAASAE